MLTIYPKRSFLIVDFQSRLMPAIDGGATAIRKCEPAYVAIEAGTIDGTDPNLKERVAALKESWDRMVEALITPRGLVET